MTTAGAYTELVIPGLHGSGDDHWQTQWENGRPGCRRVALGQWDEPTRELWMSRLDRAIARERQQVVLIAHSLGCHAVAWWAAEASTARLDKVAGALLVAPPDVDRPDVHPLLQPFAPTPVVALPFRTLLVASRNDRYASIDRSAFMADRWGATLVDVGRLGHINAESGIGDWPQGQDLADRLRAGLPIGDGESSGDGDWAHAVAPRV